MDKLNMVRSCLTYVLLLMAFFFVGAQAVRISEEEKHNKEEAAERARLEQKVMDLLASSDEILNALPVFIIKCDLHGKMVFINDEAIRVLGYKRSELIGQSVAIILPENMKVRHLAAQKRFTETVTVPEKGKWALDSVVEHGQVILKNKDILEIKIAVRVIYHNGDFIQLAVGNQYSYNKPPDDPIRLKDNPTIQIPEKSSSFLSPRRPGIFPRTSYRYSLEGYDKISGRFAYLGK